MVLPGDKAGRFDHLGENIAERLRHFVAMSSRRVDVDAQTRAANTHANNRVLQEEGCVATKRTHRGEVLKSRSFCRRQLRVHGSRFLSS